MFPRARRPHSSSRIVIPEEFAVSRSTAATPASKRVADYLIGSDTAQIDRFVEYLIRGWGTGTGLGAFAPSLAEDESAHAYWVRYQQLSASPSAARRFLRAAIDTDIRAIVPEIEIPTVVIHPTRDRVVPVELGRWLADHLPDARFVPLDSDIHMMCLSDAIDAITASIADHVHRLTASPSSTASVRS